MRKRFLVFAQSVEAALGGVLNSFFSANRTCAFMRAVAISGKGDNPSVSLGRCLLLLLQGSLNATFKPSSGRTYVSQKIDRLFVSFVGVEADLGSARPLDESNRHLGAIDVSLILRMAGYDAVSIRIPSYLRQLLCRKGWKQETDWRWLVFPAPSRMTFATSPENGLSGGNIHRRSCDLLSREAFVEMRSAA